MMLSLKELQERDIFPAHIRRADKDSGLFEVQTVFEHNLGTAEISEKLLCEIGLGKTAYLAGLIHDIGKLTDNYKEYIVKAALGENVVRGSVNHTFAGARMILREYHKDNNTNYEKLTAELIAYVIGAHHNQFDLVSDCEEIGFDHRLNEPKAQNDSIEKAIERFMQSKYTHKLRYVDVLRELFPKCVKEVSAIYASLKKEKSFHIGLVSRLILSAVIEGDRANTAAFMNAGRSEIDKADWDECLSHFEAKLAELPSDTDIAKARSILSERCKAFAARPSGIYRLSLPTGAGKTLTSLRYALTHAQKHGDKKRIIFVIPLLAIIDQNAKIIHDYIGDSCTILEHHSNAAEADSKTETGECEALDKRELMVESWNAPIIITTLFQMLNTMFSDKLSCVRRFNSLCNSVIIFDEVQTVPTKMLSLFNQTISFLSNVCCADIILCSATQPTLEYTDRAPVPLPQEMVEHDEDIWAVFKRTNIVKYESEMSCEEIADFGSNILKDKNSLLIVCNTKAEAADIYRECKIKNSPDVQCFYLSSSMCMEHRRYTLEAAESAKKLGKVILSSTQVVEAGVDVSYSGAIRIQAGMDSIVQTAGRCNRNGESDEPSNVYIVRLKEENLGQLSDIKKGREATNAISIGSKNFPDLASDEAIAAYYKAYYKGERMGHQDYVCVKDKKAYNIYSLLSCRNDLKNKKYMLTQSFKTAGSLFKVFDREGVDVIVPYGGNKPLIEELYRCDEYDIKKAKMLLKKLKPYTVSLFKDKIDKIAEQSGITSTPLGILVLDERWYDNELGVITDDNQTIII